MAFLDPMDLGFDDDDDLSAAMDTETLAANDLIPEEFADARINRSQRSKDWREFVYWTDLTLISIGYATSAYSLCNVLRMRTGL